MLSRYEHVPATRANKTQTELLNFEWCTANGRPVLYNSLFHMPRGFLPGTERERAREREWEREREREWERQREQGLRARERERERNNRAMDGKSPERCRLFVEEGNVVTNRRKGGSFLLRLIISCVHFPQILVIIEIGVIIYSSSCYFSQMLPSNRPKNTMEVINMTFVLCSDLQKSHDRYLFREEVKRVGSGQFGQYRAGRVTFADLGPF